MNISSIIELVKRTISHKTSTDQPGTIINIYESGALNRLHAILEPIFGHGPYLIITDETIWKAIGTRLANFFEHEPKITLHILPSPPPPYASNALLARISTLLATEHAVPIAVGSGTINDLVKRASFENNIRYVCIPTAPSVDGFTSFGAAITVEGFKTTLECPPPLCVIADEDIIVNAPPQLIASGYGDIMAKLLGGADWIIADAMGIEAIDPEAWKLAQDAAVALFPQGKAIHDGSPEAIGILYKGLISTGLAIQKYKDSRPASGAEHLLSHTWEMMQHSGEKEGYSHGFKVAIGSLISSAFMSELFNKDGDLCNFIEQNGFSPRTDLLQYRLDAAELLGAKGAQKTQILSTIKEKTPSENELILRAEKAQQIWPDLSKKVMRQIPSFQDLKAAFHDASCPTEPGEIGLSLEDCKKSLKIASLIRRRYTVLDLASELGALDAAADIVFSSKYFNNFI